MPQITAPKSPDERKTYLASIESRSLKLLDIYNAQCEELAEIRDPTSFGGKSSVLTKMPEERFIEYSWRGNVVRTIEESAYRELRTNRNRELLTPEEQERFAAAHVAFAGLNVGNPGAICVALEGGSRSMSLADPDILSFTNLNRFRASVFDIGTNKAELTARQIWEVDPYYSIRIERNGINAASLDDFLLTPRADVLVEEMDALPLKLAIREIAREHRIPVVMVTGNGEGVILDVERYDQNADAPLLNGMLDKTTVQTIREGTVTTPLEKVALARDFMGERILEDRLVSSFAEIGKTLVGIPQLAESSFLRGAAITWATKAIVLGRPLPSGRYTFSFDEHMKETL